MNRPFRLGLLATGSALAMMVAFEGSAAAQCFYNNTAGGVDNTVAENCISYNNGTNNGTTGLPDNVTNANTGTLTPTGIYTGGHGTNFPGTASGISVLGSGTTLTGNIINNGTINTTGATGSQGAINIGGGEFSNPVQTSGAGAAVVGSITNSGTITSAVGINVEGNSSLFSTVTGSIINTAGGQINNTNAGINVSMAVVGGSITNAGTISGDLAPVREQVNRIVSDFVSGRDSLGNREAISSRCD